MAADVPIPDAVAGTASPDFPGEWLMVHFNPRLRDERRRKREELLDAMEGWLEEIRRATGSHGCRMHRPADEAVEAYKSLAKVEQAHSFHTLLADISTIALNEVVLGSSGTILEVTTLTPGQRRAFEFLDVDLPKMFPAAGRCKTEKGLAGKGNLRF